MQSGSPASSLVPPLAAHNAPSSTSQPRFATSNDGAMLTIGRPAPTPTATAAPAATAPAATVPASTHATGSTTTPAAPSQGASAAAAMSTNTSTTRLIHELDAYHGRGVGSLDAVIATPREDDGVLHVVLDGANVAFGKAVAGVPSVFDVRKLKLALDGLQARLGSAGIMYKLVAYVPEHYVRPRSAISGAARPSHPDAMELDAESASSLQSLYEAGAVVPVPSEDMDDFYSIRHAWVHDGFIISNDRFRDHVAAMRANACTLHTHTGAHAGASTSVKGDSDMCSCSDNDVHARDAAEQWLHARRCSYTVEGGAFKLSPTSVLDALISKARARFLAARRQAAIAAAANASAGAAVVVSVPPPSASEMHMMIEDATRACPMEVEDPPETAQHAAAPVPVPAPVMRLPPAQAAPTAPMHGAPSAVPAVARAPASASAPAATAPVMPVFTDSEYTTIDWTMVHKLEAVRTASAAIAPIHFRVLDAADALLQSGSAAPAYAAYSRVVDHPVANTPIVTLSPSTQLASDVQVQADGTGMYVYTLRARALAGRARALAACNIGGGLPQGTVPHPQRISASLWDVASVLSTALPVPSLPPGVLPAPVQLADVRASLPDNVRRDVANLLIALGQSLQG